MRTPSSDISHRQHHVAGKLALDVHVELLDHAQLEVQVCYGLQSAPELGKAGGLRQRLADRAAVDAETLRYALSEGGKGRSKVRGILPQALGTLVPRGIVKDRVARADCSLVICCRGPSQADPWLEGSIIGRKAYGRTGILARNQELTGSKVKVRLAIERFGDGRDEGPG